MERINRNCTKFDFIVLIIGGNHYDNICELIKQNSLLALSPNSFNIADPNILERMGNIFMNSLGSDLLLDN
jgi:hypothetical protein